MNHRIKWVCATIISITMTGAVCAASHTDEEAAVAAVLNGLHDAAAKADYERYFGFYASSAIFLGTDATERWNIEQFKAFAAPVFAKGRGWTYVAKKRWITLSADGNTAWFDETLENSGLGDCRGSGVLAKQDGMWLITQYNLTIPIPNELANEFVDRIREQKAAK